MTDDIRKAAIEAACVEFTRGDMPSWRRWEEDERNETREAMARAISAYERAMWRPAGEAEFDTDYLVRDGGGSARMAFLCNTDVWRDAVSEERVAVSRFRPLPLPPEDEA